MPKATLPTTAKGWVISVIASFVGFVAGVAALSFLGRLWH